MARKIVIGDIHGCNLTFNSLLFEHLDIYPEDEIYLLGDCIDRGPDSIGVVNTILALKENGYQLTTLRGNHEQMMIDSSRDVSAYFQWLFNGGDTTMENFKVKRFQDMPDIYKEFFQSTTIYVELEKFILCHAGLNFENDDLFVDQDFMLWGRGFKSNQPKLGSKLLIHGHTPKPLEYILKQRGNVYNLDGGCVFGKRRKGMGYLVALILDEMKFVYAKCIDN